MQAVNPQLDPQAHPLPSIPLFSLPLPLSILPDIRNNKNAKHSPRWAVRAGLVKDYKKKPSNGWDDRYGEGAEAYDRQQIEVDPITGETRMDPDAGKRLGGKPRPQKKSKLLSPWGDNPEGEDWAERHGSGNVRDDERRGDRESQDDDDEGGERDPVTGAIIGERRAGGRRRDERRNDDNDDGLRRTQSRNSTRSNASRYNYADRYGLNGRGNNSSNSSFTRSDQMSSSSSIKKSKVKKEKVDKKKKKDRFERENENGYGDQNSNSWEEEERRYAERNGGGHGQSSKKSNNDPLNDNFQF